MTRGNVIKETTQMNNNRKPYMDITLVYIKASSTGHILHRAGMYLVLRQWQNLWISCSLLVPSCQLYA